MHNETVLSSVVQSTNIFRRKKQRQPTSFFLEWFHLIYSNVDPSVFKVTDRLKAPSHFQFSCTLCSVTGPIHLAPSPPQCPFPCWPAKASSVMLAPPCFTVPCTPDELETLVAIMALLWLFSMEGLAAVTGVLQIFSEPEHVTLQRDNAWWQIFNSELPFSFLGEIQTQTLFTCWTGSDLFELCSITASKAAKFCNSGNACYVFLKLKVQYS